MYIMLQIQDRTKQQPYTQKNQKLSLAFTVNKTQTSMQDETQI